MARVSIITPLFNGAQTLREAYQSVLSQDFEDWEWILFDDGSTDDTKKMAKSISDEYPEKIFFYEHEGSENFGTAYTRNRAIEKSNGEIISFIDQDDIWYDNRLSHQLGVFDNLRDCSMIWSPALYWYKERTFKQPVGINGKGIASGIYEAGYFTENFLKDLKSTPLPSASMVRRKYFDDVNGFEELVKGSEDIVLWLKLANKFKIYYDDKIIVKYRKHFDSTLRQAIQSGKMNEWNLIFYKWVLEFIKTNSIQGNLTEEYEFAYYKCLKRIYGKKKYFESRRGLRDALDKIPDLKRKFQKDFILDILLPFDLATRVSAKIRFDWLKK